MKRILYLLLPFFFISCSGDDDHNPSITTQSYTAEIGDLITLNGNNLGGVQSIRIFNVDYSIKGADIMDKPRGNYLHYNYFTSQSDTQIQFILPQLYSHSYFIRVGDQDIPLNIKGFIPLSNILEDNYQGVSGLKVFDENRALGRIGRRLYLLENGYHDQHLISNDVHFFDILPNGDSWYARSSDYEFHEIFYNAAGTSSYNLLTSFKRRDLNTYIAINHILVTPGKQVYISTDEETFIIEDNELKKAVDLFPGLEAYSSRERGIYSFDLTPQGLVYGRLNSENGFLVLNPNDHTFAFSEQFTSSPHGPIFRNNTGYIILPLENRLYKSRDGGHSWSESPTPTPTPGGNLRGTKMNVLDANTVMLFLHSSSGSNFPSTVAYISRDGGNSWQERKKFNAPVEINHSVQYSDFNNEGGLINFTKGAINYYLWKYVP